MIKKLITKRFSEITQKSHFNKLLNAILKSYLSTKTKFIKMTAPEIFFGFVRNCEIMTTERPKMFKNYRSPKRLLFSSYSIEYK